MDEEGTDDMPLKSPMKRLGSTRKLHLSNHIRAQLTEQVRCMDVRMETQVAIVGELQDYFRRRAEVELDYSKNLDKLVRTLQLRHKEQRQKREQWPLFSSYSCWQQLLTQTRDLSRDHAILSEVYSSHLTSRLSQVMEDVQRIYRKCRDIGFETHEEIFRVLHELHTSMKTCHAYAAECRQAHSKLRIATTQRLKMEAAAPSKEKLARSKKYRLIEKEVLKRKSKYNDARLKAVKARNDYVLCLEAANTTVHKYFVDDLSDLIDCMDFGFHSCISRAILMHISAGEWCGQGAKNGLDSVGSCVASLDSRRDKRRFLEAHHAAFMIPKKFEFQHMPRGSSSSTSAPTIAPPTPGGGSSAAAAAMAGATEEVVVGVEGAPELQKVLREELEARLGQLRSRLTSLRTESEEVWKTLETAERTLLDMVSAKDYDCSHFFLQNSAATGPHLSSSTATISINESTQPHHAPPVLVPPSSSSSSTSSSSSSSSSSLVSSVQASSGSSVAPTPCTGGRGQGSSGAIQTPSSSSSSAISQTGSGGSTGGGSNKAPETMSLKLRADRHETEEFYISKFREYLLGTSRIARLHSKHDHIQNVLLPSSSCGGPIGGRNSPTLPGISPMGSNHSVSNNSGNASLPPSVPASGVLVLPRSVLGPGGSAIVGRTGVVGGGGGGQQRRKRIGRLQLRMGQPKLFGGSLEEYLEATDMEIPLVVKSCIRVINLYGLHHQGIFRVSGSQVEINNFREAFERGEDPLADMTDASDINSVAGVLKLYLRELREPLFPIIYFEHFMELAQLESKHDFVIKMRELIQSLPRSVVVVLRYIFAFLNHLSEFSDENMMDPYNLAICFGPTLVPVPEDRDQVQYQNQVNDLIKNIILFNEDIFPDDGGIVYEKFISKEPDDNDVGDSPSDHVQEDLDSEVYPSEDEAETLEATAQFDFLARSERELSLKKGENITLYNQVSGDWWRGCVNGREGLVPDKYILLKIKDEDRDRLELLKSSSEESMRRRASSSNDSLLSGHSTTPLSSTASASSSSAAVSVPVNGIPPNPPAAPEPIVQDTGSPCKLDQSSPEPSPTQVQRVHGVMTPGPPSSYSTASSVFFPESKGEIVPEVTPPVRSPSMSAVVEAVLAELPPEGEQMGLLTHQRSASEGPVSSSGHQWGTDAHENGDEKHGGITDDSSVAGDTTEEECSSRPDTPVSTASEGDGIPQKGSNFHRASTTWKSQSVGEVGGGGGGVFGRNREAWQRRAASQSHLEPGQQSAPSSTNLSPAPSSLFRSSVEFWELRQKHTPDLVMDLPPTGAGGGKVEQEYGVGRRRRRKKAGGRRGVEGDVPADRDGEAEDEEEEGGGDDSSSSGSGNSDVGGVVIPTSNAGGEVIPEGGGSSSPGPESPDMTAAERFAKQNQCTLKKKVGSDAQSRKKMTAATCPADSVEAGSRAVSRTPQSNSSDPTGLKAPTETAQSRSPGPVTPKFPSKVGVSPSGSRPPVNAPPHQPPGVAPFKPPIKAKPALLKKPVLPPHHSPELSRRVDKPEQN